LKPNKKDGNWFGNIEDKMPAQTGIMVPETEIIRAH